MKRTNNPNSSQGESMPEESMLNICSHIYFISLIVAALAGGVSIAAGIIQYKLSNVLSERLKSNVAVASKDAAYAKNDTEKIKKENIVLNSNLTNAIADADVEKQKLAKMQIEVADARRKQAEAEKALEVLKVEAKKAARGITSTYDFNGAKRESVSGRMQVTAGEELAIFEQIIKLEKERKYPALLALCKQQIAKTPKWLTPYLFLGLSQLNMGMNSDAISNFEHVIENAPGDPNYQQAHEFLKQLKGK